MNTSTIVCVGAFDVHFFHLLLVVKSIRGRLVFLELHDLISKGTPLVLQEFATAALYIFAPV